jgi:hypothetical protein
MQLQNTLEIENINLYERSTPIKVAKGEVTASQDMQDGPQCLNLKKKNKTILRYEESMAYQLYQRYR